MIEAKTITVPRTMSLKDRISLVSKQILTWLKSCDEPLYIEKNQLRLVKFEKNTRNYSYHYEMVPHEDLSASDVNKSH